MPKKKTPDENPKEQFKRFLEVAREKVWMNTQQRTPSRRSPRQKVALTPLQKTEELPHVQEVIRERLLKLGQRFS